MAPPLGRWVRALGPLVLYAGLIFVLSSQSSLTAKLPGFLLSDKVAHLAEYSLFGFLAARALGILTRQGPLFAAGLAIVIGACYGASDELHQSFVPGRESDPWDLLADVAGSALGAGVYLAWILTRARRRSSGETGPEALGTNTFEARRES